MHRLPSGLLARAAALLALALLAAPLQAQLVKPQDGLLYPGNRHPHSFPHEVKLIDVEGDGDLDLVFLEPFTNSLNVRRNLGFGTITYTWETYPELPTILPDRLAVGDRDGDGDPDLVEVGNGPQARLISNSEGDFVTAQMVPIATPGSDLRAVTAGNVVAGGGDEAVILVDTASTDFAAVVDGFAMAQQLPLTGVAVPDFPLVLDADGDLDGDLLLADTIGKRLRFAAGNGAGLLPTVTVAVLSESPTALAAGPLNADAWPDLVAPIGSGSIALLLSTGPAAWSVHEQALLAGPVDAALLAPLDGRTQSVLVAERVRQRLELLHLAGSELQLDASLRVGSGPLSLATGELDGDGHLDLAIAHSGLDAPIFQDGDI